MPIRNPFSRRAAADDVGPPDAAGHHGDTPGAADGAAARQPVAFERVDTVGSKVASTPSVHSRRSQDTGEYKMSVVNDSGVYLPPSPTERDDRAFWPVAAVASGSHARRFRPKAGLAPTSAPGAAGSSGGGGTNSLGRASAETSRTSLGGGGDLEPFVISRESFDSYRRSFDISARSPVPAAAAAAAGPGRQSLDANVRWRGSQPLALSARTGGGGGGGVQSPAQSFPPADEGFEDVGLDEQQGQQPGGPSVLPAAHAATAFLRKRGAFFKFGSDHADDGAAAVPAGSSSTSRFPFPGRKRAASGQGAELKAMDHTDTQELS